MLNKKRNLSKKYLGMRPFFLLDIQRTSYCPSNDVYHSRNLDILLMTKLEQRLDANVQRQILVRLKSIEKQFMRNFEPKTHCNVMIDIYAIKKTENYPIFPIRRSLQLCLNNLRIVFVASMLVGFWVQIELVSIIPTEQYQNQM